MLKILPNPPKFCLVHCIFLLIIISGCTFLIHIWAYFIAGTQPFFSSIMYQNVIPPSDGESSDEEVFQTFLQANNLTKISDAEYQLPTSNVSYSQLAAVQISPTPCK